MVVPNFCSHFLWQTKLGLFVRDIKQETEFRGSRLTKEPKGKSGGVACPRSLINACSRDGSMSSEFSNRPVRGGTKEMQCGTPRHEIAPKSQGTLSFFLKRVARTTRHPEGCPYYEYKAAIRSRCHPLTCSCPASRWHYLLVQVALPQ